MACVIETDVMLRKLHVVSVYTTGAAPVDSQKSIITAFCVDSISY